MRTEHWRLDKPVIRNAKGMVAAQHHLAARAGAGVLHKGGNAVDAAVAAALALGVVEPWMCGLGGSGLMIIWQQANQQAVLIDFQGVLPERIDTADYPVDPTLPPTLMGFPAVVNERNVKGYASISVPGTAAGLAAAVKRFGSVPLADVVAPAHALALDPPPSDWFSTLQTALAMPIIAADPVSRELYLPQGYPLQPATRLSNPALARTLKEYADGGPDAFYRGAIAERLLFDLAGGGSQISAEDLAGYAPDISVVSAFRYRQYELYNGGKSTGGTRLNDFLSRLSARSEDGHDAPTTADWIAIANALEYAWARHHVRIGRTGDATGCTSHLSTADADGNMVALTHTLLNRFGSGVTLPATGLLMNNAVSYFDPRPGYPTSLSPCRRINASNMCPTIATHRGRACLSIGASGGNHIMPAVAQVIAFMLEFGMDLQTAMHMPRLDAGAYSSIKADPRLDSECLHALAAHHEVEVAERLVFPKLYGSVTAVSCEGGAYCGSNDPQQPIGAAMGPTRFELPDANARTPAPNAWA